MNQAPFTPGTSRPNYVTRDDNKLIRMVIPFIVGLIIGYGANGLVEKAQHNSAGNGGAQYQSGNPNQ